MSRDRMKSYTSNPAAFLKFHRLRKLNPHKDLPKPNLESVLNDSVEKELLSHKER